MTRWTPGLPHYEHPNPEFLRGLGAIAEYLDISTNMVKQLIFYDGLPAFQLPNGSWFTSKKCLVAWSFIKSQADIDRLREAKQRLENEPRPIPKHLVEESKQILSNATRAA